MSDPSAKTYITSEPYPWPWNGDLRPANTALIVIDMQTDFCGKGGYIDLLGYDIGITRAVVPAIQRLLDVMRDRGFHIFHTREGHRPDLADLPANKRWRSRKFNTISTDVCVHTTMREANDRGYECVLLTDCCAATDPANHKAAINMVKMQNGVFGAVSNSTHLIKALT